MRARVAVATVQGKAYFLIVNELKRRNIRFLSLVPDDPIPTEIKTVITTQNERKFVTHERALVYNPEADPAIMGTEVVKTLLGKQNFESVVLGIDPGEVFGIAVVADGMVLEAENCFGPREVLKYIKRTLKVLDLSKTIFTVKIGSGVPIYHELTQILDDELPLEVSLEIVGEAGTNGNSRNGRNRRGYRHVISATHIARRNGYTYPRRRAFEENC